MTRQDPSAGTGPPGVWAPDASSVELVVEGERRRLERRPDGWWTGTGAALPPGTDYAFSVDGGPPRPDPRAPSLPDGVHGPARTVDQAAFAWTDHGWTPPRLADGVVYELHVGTFSPQGTFDGVVERLDHLVDLGVSHVELMPVHSFPGVRGWGYDVAGLFAPHGPYGGPDGLRRLVDACHRRGLAVILDVVWNHLGPEGNYLGTFGPYVTDRFRTPWGGAVNLGEPGADEVRRLVLDNAVMWLRDYHVDGLRIDAVHAFVDLTAVHLLEELAERVRRLEDELGRPLVLIAESDLNDPRLLRDQGHGGYGLDAQWSDDFHHAIHVTLTGDRSGYYEDFAGLADVARALERVFVYEGQPSAHRGRRHGRPADGLGSDRFLGYAQNHDQVGNRALGERLAHLAGERAARVAAALVLTGPFVPLLFAGEEWGASTPFRFFTDYGDTALWDAVRDGRRREFAAFGWAPEDVPDPQDPGTFEASRLDWAELGREPHAGLLAWHRQLIRLRRDQPGLRDPGRPVVSADAAAGTLVVERPGTVLAVNVADATRTIELSPGRHRVLAASDPDDTGLDRSVVRLAPMSAAVLARGAETGVRAAATTRPEATDTATATDPTGPRPATASEARG